MNMNMNNRPICVNPLPSTDVIIFIPSCCSPAVVRTIEDQSIPVARTNDDGWPGSVTEDRLGTSLGCDGR